MSEIKEENTAGKMIKCSYCGGEFDEMLAGCPFCNSTNIKGAQAEYMDKLEDVREDLQQLTELPMEEVENAARKGRKLVTIAVVIALMVFVLLGAFVLIMQNIDKRDVKADLTWQLENYPKLDVLYENGEYRELVEWYDRGYENEWPIQDWEHYWFLTNLSGYLWVSDIVETKSGTESYTANEYEDILYYGLKIRFDKGDSLISADEREKLKPYAEIITTEMNRIFDFSTEDMQAFEKEAADNYGIVSFDTCKKYVEKWQRSNQR